jgi:AcrR family transcriptional regulator
VRERGAESRKAATQQRILRAAMALFAARGFDRTSVTQIAARSGVSRAAIFWHFGDKATLFRETCRHFLVPFRDSLERSGVQRDPRQQILDQISAYERFVDENRHTIHAFVSWIFSSPDHSESLRQELLALHSAFRRSLERAANELLRDAGEASALATALVSMLHGNMLLQLGGAPQSGRIGSARLWQALLDRARAESPPHASSANEAFARFGP